MDTERIAEKIYALLPPWEQADGSVKDVIEQMASDPEAIMEFLLDVIDGNA